MKGSELLSLWASPDNSRLTAKQFTIRLPLHVAAKISALCDMYPNKNRTEITGDLLATGLESIEAAFPIVPGKVYGSDPDTNEEFFDDVGPGKKYRALTSKYLKALELELERGKSGNLGKD